MTKLSFILLGLFVSPYVYSQTLVPKILLTNGQKITVESVVSMETSMSPGMDIINNNTSENTLEVKNITDKQITISNSLTKLKVEMNMMGQTTSYDSEKKDDQNTDIGKALGEKLNKPADVILDNTTGMALPSEKKKEKKNDATDENPLQGLLQMFGDNSDDAIVSGAFELIPEGKKVGDSWADSTMNKDMKVARTFILKSITGNEALIHLNSVIDAVSTIEMQGMQVDMNSNTQSFSEIITDIASGLVKKKTTKATVTGNFEIMGQSVPINAKATTTNTYH